VAEERTKLSLLPLPGKGPPDLYVSLELHGQCKEVSPSILKLEDGNRLVQQATGLIRVPSALLERRESVRMFIISRCLGSPFLQCRDVCPLVCHRPVSTYVRLHTGVPKYIWHV
jgi:hypothetical protein